ncbi:hypothetical protein HK102_004493, partial [Quaeritorhiza haematococci]
MIAKEKPAWSGVATFVPKGKAKLLSMGLPEEPDEGRVVTTAHDGFVLVNVYNVNGTSNDDRRVYKVRFHDALQSHCRSLRAEYANVVVIGDFNTAKEPIDVYLVQKYQNMSTFLPEERQWMKDFCREWDDTFRHHHGRRIAYTWWEPRAKYKNWGLRVDYAFTTPSLKHVTADIHTEVPGSDHCPISLIIETEKKADFAKLPQKVMLSRRVQDDYLITADYNVLLKPDKRIYIGATVGFPVPIGRYHQIHATADFADQGLEVLGTRAVDTDGALRILIANVSDEDLEIRAYQHIADFTPTWLGHQPVIEYEEDKKGVDAPIWIPKPMPAQVMLAKWIGKRRWKLPRIPDHHIDRRPEMPQEGQTVHLIKCLWGRKATLRQIKAVYDTGATGNLISRKEWMKLPKRERIECPYDGPPLAGIGNGTVEPKTMARIAIVMGGARRTIDVGIAEDEDFPVLLGTDFIDRYVAYHNVEEGWLQLIGEKKRVPIKTYEDGNGRSADMVAALAITSQSTMERDHAQLLTVRTVVRPPKLACVEFGTIPLVTGALVESGVIGEEQWKKVGCSYWTTEVFIRNLLPRHLHLRAGQIVGKVYEIEEEDVDLIDCTPSDEATARQKNAEVIAVDAEDSGDVMAGQKTPSVEEQAEAFLAETLGQAEVSKEKGKVAVAEKGGNGARAKTATVNCVLLVNKNADDARRDTAAYSKGAAQNTLHIQQPIAEDVATAIRKSAEVEARVREDADPRAKFFDET